MIIGTAGHIDHGKTSLVRELTGIDTDRLPEEKRRGKSVEWYAWLRIPVDVRSVIGKKKEFWSRIPEARTEVQARRLAILSPDQYGTIHGRACGMTACLMRWSHGRSERSVIAAVFRRSEHLEHKNHTHHKTSLSW